MNSDVEEIRKKLKLAGKVKLRVERLDTGMNMLLIKTRMLGRKVEVGLPWAPTVYPLEDYVEVIDTGLDAARVKIERGDD